MRSRHPNKEIEAALKHAEAHGWRVQVGGSHRWGAIYCRERSREGCMRSVWSTPKHPEAHAKDLRRAVDDCPHQPREEPQ